MMGAGKSTVGRALATRIGLPFVDVDTMVEGEAGRSIPELFAEGEEHFRRLEADVLSTVGQGPEPAVVAVGGGAVLAEANRRVLAGTGTVVWLRAAPSTLRARLEGGDGRPLLARAGDVGLAVEKLVAVRAPYYADVADLIVDVDGLGVVDVVDAVQRRLQAIGRR
jgi:shikimate kinase